MASQVYSNCFLWVQGKDMSAYVRSATLNFGSEMLDDTNMGDTFKVNMGGLKTATLDVTFSMDCSTGAPENVLYPIVGTTSCVEFRYFNVCATGSNPSFWFVGVIDKLPLGGAVGSHFETAVTWQMNSALTRATAS